MHYRLGFACILLGLPAHILGLRRAGPGTYIDVNVYTVNQRGDATCDGEPMHRQQASYYGFVHDYTTDPNNPPRYEDTDFSSYDFPASMRIYIDSVNSNGDACIGFYFGHCTQTGETCLLSSSRNAAFTNEDDKFIHLSSIFQSRSYTKFHG